MISSRDCRFVRKLLGICSVHDSSHRCRHVSALVDKNHIISIGVNTLKTSPKAVRYSGSNLAAARHAEFQTLSGLRTEAKGNTLYVVRMDRNGNAASSKPCISCQKMIKEYKIKRVVYTVDNGVKEWLL